MTSVVLENTISFASLRSYKINRQLIGGCLLLIVIARQLFFLRFYALVLWQYLYKASGAKASCWVAPAVPCAPGTPEHQFLVHQVHQGTSTPGPGAPKHENTSSWAWSDPYFKPAWVAMMTVKQGVIGVILQKHWRRWWNVYYRHLPTPPDAALGVVSLHCCTFLH